MTWDTTQMTLDASEPTWDSSTWVIEVLAVYPDAGDVASGVEYGPNGNDFTGTLVAGGNWKPLARDLAIQAGYEVIG